MFKISGYYKFGLLKDDFLWDYDEDVAEALRRAPEHIRMERIYRAIKAQQAEISHTLLPEEEWTKIDDVSCFLIFLVISFNWKCNTLCQPVLLLYKARYHNFFFMYSFSLFF